MRHGDTSAGWLDRRQAEGLRRGAVAEAMAGSGAGVVHRRRRVALVASGRDRHDREGDGAVQLRLDSGRGGPLLGPLGRAGVGSLTTGWRRRAGVGGFSAGWGLRVGAASSVLGRVGRARTGAGRLCLGGGRAAATVLRGRGGNSVATFGNGADGRRDGDDLRGH